MQQEICGGKNSVACNWQYLAKRNSARDFKFLGCLSKECQEVVDAVALAKELFMFVSRRLLNPNDGFFAFPNLDGKRLIFHELASKTAQLAVYVLPQVKFLRFV